MLYSPLRSISRYNDLLTVWLWARHCDSEKEYTCQKGLPVGNWAKIYNQSPVAIIYRGLSHILHIREKLQTELPSLLHCVPTVWAKYYKGVPGTVLQSMGQSWTSQSSSIRTNWTNQSNSIRTNKLHKNTQFWPIRTVLFGSNCANLGSPFA